MEMLSDEQLMVGVLSGETRALSVLVERHYGPLLGYLYRFLGGDRPLAEDIVQETFLRVLQRGGYQPGRPFKPWLYAIAINQGRDYFKSARVRRDVAQDEEIMEGISIYLAAAIAYVGWLMLLVLTLPIYGGALSFSLLSLLAMGLLGIVFLVIAVRSIPVVITRQFMV